MFAVLSMAGCRDVPAVAPAPSVPAALEPALAAPSTATPELSSATAAPTATPTWAATVAPTPMATATRSTLNQQTSTPAAAKKQTMLTTVKFTSQALAGNLLGDPATRTIYILLPPEYATSNKRYPVVYVLHGYNGRGDSMVTALKLPLDKALGSDAVQDMIMVFPDANTRLGAVGTWTARPRAATRPTSRRSWLTISMPIFAR